MTDDSPGHRRRMTHASLFSGIGGPEVAAYILGWENLFHCDINEFSRTVLDYWFPNSESYKDVKNQDFTKWGGYVDVLTGGFPCQPFSVAGQRKGTEDDRYLWPHFKRAITEIKPRWVVGENVAGIASMVQPSEGVVLESQADLFGETTDRVEVVERYVIETICQDLESIGYSVQPIVIPACAVGAPHRRDRVFFLARRTDAGVAPDAVVAGIKGLRKRKIDSYSAGIVANSEGEQSRPRPRQRQISDERKRKFRGGRRENHPRQQIERLCRGERCWESFPTQSPICGGDDGFPVSLDALSVPFQQWRRDSIKAYGNAIVPQVMLEIFKAIETVEQTHTKQ